MSKAPLRALIVGLGQIGFSYDCDVPPESEVVLTHSRALHVHPRFDLRGGVDVDQQRCLSFSRTYQVERFGALFRGLVETEPDVLVISTPTSTHLEVVEDVLAVWIPKYILVEKPLASTVGQGVQIQRLCSTAGSQLFVNYMRRSEPAVEIVRSMIAREEYARPFVGSVNYSGGVMNSASHFVNLFELWFGQILQIQRHDSRKSAEGDDPDLNFDLFFDGGLIHFLAASGSDYASTGFDIAFQNGRLRTFNGGNDFEWQEPRPDPYYPGRKILGQVGRSLETDAIRSQWHVVDQIAKHCDGMPARLCDGSAAMSTFRSVSTIL